MPTSWRNFRKRITTENQLIKLAECLPIQSVGKHVDAIDQKLTSKAAGWFDLHGVEGGGSKRAQ